MLSGSSDRVAKLAVGARDTATDAAAHSTEISTRRECLHEGKGRGRSGHDEMTC